MLPIHRTMKKDGRGNFYNDDKYDKSGNKNISLFKLFKKMNRKALVASIFGIFVIYYLYHNNTFQRTNKNIIKDDFTPVTAPPFVPTIHDNGEFVPDDGEQFYEPAEDDFDNELEVIMNHHQQEGVVSYSDFLFTQYPPPASLLPNDKVTAARQQRIVKAFQHAWKGYTTDAFGKDEYQPLTHTGHNWAQGGLGLMIIDSLDTLLLMNLTTEYNQAREWIRTELDFNKDQDVNVFETTIRILGGLLSAYHLSDNDRLYLDKAVDLGDRLLQAFDTPSGIPHSGVFLSSGKPMSHGPSSTAEATTIQLEFKYLSYLTDDMRYWNAAEKVMERMNELVNDAESGALDGLVPIYIDAMEGNFVSREIRLGSRGDSYYEYLLKQYLQTDKTEIKYRERYDHAIEGIKKHLIQYSTPNNLMYIAELMDSTSPSNKHPKMDHLVCFMGGSFVLGVTEGASIYELDPLDKKDLEDYRMGKEITRTCYKMYNRTATGLASEIVYFTGDHDMEIHSRDAHNLLRPETLESIFLLYRMTGEEEYREWGWNIFESFEKHTKLEQGGYAALKDVTKIPAPMDNRMDTFFLAETLKYLYLLFSPEDLIPLESYIFNTEAHPLPVFSPN